MEAGKIALCLFALRRYTKKPSLRDKHIRLGRPAG